MHKKQPWYLESRIGWLVFLSDILIYLSQSQINKSSSVGSVILHNLSVLFTAQHSTIQHWPILLSHQSVDIELVIPLAQEQFLIFRDIAGHRQTIWWKQKQVYLCCSQLKQGSVFWVQNMTMLKIKMSDQFLVWRESSQWCAPTPLWFPESGLLRSGGSFPSFAWLVWPTHCPSGGL